MSHVVAVVVHYRGVDMTTACVASLPAEVAVVVVDNSGDADQLRERLADRADTLVVGDGSNLGFGRACNLGVAASQRPLLAFVNPDARPSAADLSALVSTLNTLHDRSRVAAVGPALVDVTGCVQVDGGGWLPTPARSLTHALLSSRAGARGIWIRPVQARHHHVEWISGTCLIIFRRTFDSVGGFDDSYPLYNEDMDLGARLGGAGWHLVLDGCVRVQHLRGGSGTAQPADVRRLWQLRGSALGVYLQRHASTPSSAWLMQSTFAAGFLLRAGVHRVFGRRTRMHEMLTYAREVRRAEPMELT